MEVIYTKQFSNAISLGADCRVRYQLSLSRYKRAQQGEMAIRDFELQLYSSNQAVQPSGTFPFDWWVTPFSAVLECIRSDFAGLFERQSLEINANGLVRDARYGIIFPHAFSHKDGPVTPEILENEYGAQRRKVDYLVEKFRAQQRQDKPVLYVAVGPTVADARKLFAMLAPTQPQAHVLAVQMDPVTAGVIHEEEGITHYQMSSENNKPAVAKWQGDNEHWGNLLDRIDFG
jgi:hypothetical protein